MTPKQALTQFNIGDHELAETYMRLGDVLLIPITESLQLPEDRAAFPKPPKSVTSSLNEEYLSWLARSNLAVLLGPVSGNLYAVSFRTDDAATTFARTNAVARQTAALDGFGATVFFFRIEGFVPPPVAWLDGEWLGRGKCWPVRIKNAIGDHDWLTDCTPAIIQFADLVWPSEVQALFAPHIIEERYGKPFYPERKGSGLNYTFWAHYFARETRVRYCEERGEFYRLDLSEPGWTLLSAIQLETSILDFLMAQGRKPGFEPLQRPLAAAARRELITELKVVAVGKLPGLEEGLRRYVVECLENSPGSSVSVHELYSLYQQYCLANSFPILSEGRFQRLSPELIQRQHHVDRSHGIERQTGQVRGYRNLRLKLAVWEGGERTLGTTASEVAENPEPENHRQSCSSGHLGRLGR